jgi:Short C-terminal domain
MSLTDELQKLEQLRQAGTLSTAEFAQAKAVLLNTASSITDSGKLEQLTREAELARIDREWELEKQGFNVLSRYGIQQRPSKAGGIGGALLGGGFGAFWTYMVSSMPSSSSNVTPFNAMRIAFPIFGVIFTSYAIWTGISMYFKAQGYELAEQAYLERRAKVQNR